MLIEFSVGNYRSFFGPVRFSMVAAKFKSKSDLDEKNTFESNRLTLLKSAAIYGANASGKSNFVKAFDFMSKLALNSSKETQAKEKINVDPFLLANSTDDQPSYFEVILVVDNIRYRYGFEVSTDKVLSEWLYYVPKAREAPLFARKNQNIKITHNFKEGKGLEEKTRENALFLSVVAQFNGSRALSILDWFRSTTTVLGVNDPGLKRFTQNLSLDQDIKKEILGIISNLDVGINDLEITSVPTTPEERDRFKKRARIDQAGDESFVDFWTSKFSVKSLHNVYNDNRELIKTIPFDFDKYESEGTQKLFYLLGPILYAIKLGKVIFIDELDARLHPLIMQQIIQLFNSKENNTKSQLIFTTHNTSLLSSSLFRRDQIWFAEKDPNGESHLYSLAEYKIRKNAKYEKDYIAGKYGAIPFIGDVESVMRVINATTKQ